MNKHLLNRKRKRNLLLLSEHKLIICAFVNLHYQISREKFEPEPGLELGPLPCSSMLFQEEGLRVNG